MAQTIIATTDPLTQKAWAKDLWTTAMPMVTLSPFIGKDEGSAIVWRDELNRGAGDKVTFGLVHQLQQLGTLGDDTAKGNGEALNLTSCSIAIDQLRSLVTLKGAMSQQRISASLRETAKGRSAAWWKARVDTSLIAQLAGLADQGLDVRLTGLQTPIRPDGPHWIVAGTAGNGGLAAEQALSSGGGATQYFGLQLLDIAVNRARTMSTPIVPFQIGGEELYCCAVHPNQTYQMRTNSAGDTRFQKISEQALAGGLFEKNAYTTGGFYRYNNVIVVEDARVPFGTTYQINQSLPTGTAGVCRAVFFGAQAATFATGRAYDSPEKFKWVEVLDDGNNVLDVYAGLIFGCVKNTFTPIGGGTAQDFATIAISSYSPAP